VRRELAPWLTGRAVTGVELLAPRGPKYRDLERAQGQTVESVSRRGKFLLLPLSGGDELVIHLGMTGVVSSSEPAGKASEHVRVRLRLSGADPNTLHFHDPRRFGRFLVVRAGEYANLPTLAALGPEPLADAFTTEAFARSLAASSMAVKAYLLSQRPVAGVGNIYADEALWRARVHPRTPAARLPAAKVAALHGAIREVLAASIAAHGTTLSDYRTVNGQSGSFGTFLDAYGRAGQPCRRCGRELRRSLVGQRGTVFCPNCQRLVAGAHPARGATRSSPRGPADD